MPRQGHEAHDRKEAAGAEADNRRRRRRPRRRRRRRHLCDGRGRRAELLASDDEATKAEEAELLGLDAKASPAPGTPPRQPLTAASNQANGGSPPVAMQLSGDEGDEDL